jgi:hypothetical protein
VTAAAEYAGVSRAMVFRWRRDDPEFALRWDEAVQMGVDRGSRTRRTGARSTAWRDRCIRAAPRSARYANIPTSCCWLARCQFWQRTLSYSARARYWHSCDRYSRRL